MRMNQEVKAKWLEALRSGNYVQGREELRPRHYSGGYAYCCLGVLCDVYQKETGKGEWREIGCGSWDSSFDATEEGAPVTDKSWSSLPQAVVKWAGFYTNDPTVPNPKGNGKDRITLANLNDAGTSFEELAEIIEREF